MNKTLLCPLLVILAFIPGCVCPGGELRGKVGALCDQNGGLHAMHFSRVKVIECADGTMIDADKAKRGE